MLTRNRLKQISDAFSIEVELYLREKLNRETPEQDSWFPPPIATRRPSTKPLPPQPLIRKGDILF